MLQIQLCGRFAVVVDGRAVQDALPGRRGRLLVAYLAAERAEATDRAVLGEVLWPDSPPDSTSVNLTVLLSKVRSVIAPAEIHGRGSLQLVLPYDSRVDLEIATVALHQAESALSQQHWQRAWAEATTAHLTLRRRFLAEFDGLWVDQWRDRLDLAFERALACFAEACLRLGGTELPGAERAARRLIALAPLSETGYQLLMRALRERGDPASALTVYDQLRRLMREELGVAPGPTVQAVHRTLLGD